MLILLFILMVIFGLSRFRNEQKGQNTLDLFLDISFDQTSASDKFEVKLLKYNFGHKLLDVFHEFLYYFKGPDNNLLKKHLLFLLFSTAIIFLVNATYVKFNPFLIVPATIIATIYMLYLLSKKRVRLEFETSFAEALNIIGSAVSVGSTVVAGIEQCGERLSDTILGKVFKRVYKRLEIGEDMEVVLMDSYNQIRYKEYYFFIMAILVNMKGGGQLKEIMSRLGQIISSGRIMERKKYAMTSEARMSIKILALIPVVMFFLIGLVSPENQLLLTTDKYGKIILAYVAGSTLLGLAIAWSMMNKA